MRFMTYFCIVKEKKKNVFVLLYILDAMYRNASARSSAVPDHNNVIIIIYNIMYCVYENTVKFWYCPTKISWRARERWRRRRGDFRCLHCYCWFFFFLCLMCEQHEKRRSYDDDYYMNDRRELTREICRGRQSERERESARARGINICKQL